MAKTESTFINMLLALFLVALLSCTALSTVFLLTKDAIAASKLKQKSVLLKEVLPAFDNDPVAEKFLVNTPNGEMTFYPAKKNGVLVAAAVETFSMKGYAGRIDILAGFLVSGMIYNTVVISHKETPGLGSKMEASQSSFSTQFKDKDPSIFRMNVKKDGGDVDAITAATISSRAYCDALRTAHDAFKTHFLK